MGGVVGGGGSEAEVEECGAAFRELDVCLVVLLGVWV